MIKDMGSMHGTHLNGNKLHPRQQTPLRSGDIIQFGDKIIKGADSHEGVRVTFDRPESSTQRSQTLAHPSQPTYKGYQVPQDSDDDSHYDSEDDYSPASDIEDLNKSSAHTTPEQAKAKPGSHERPIDLDKLHEPRPNVITLEDDVHPVYRRSALPSYSRQPNKPVPQPFAMLNEHKVFKPSVSQSAKVVQDSIDPNGGSILALDSVPPAMPRRAMMSGNIVNDDVDSDREISPDRGNTGLSRILNEARSPSPPVATDLIAHDDSEDVMSDMSEQSEYFGDYPEEPDVSSEDESNYDLYGDDDYSDSEHAHPQSVPHNGRSSKKRQASPELGTPAVPSQQTPSQPNLSHGRHLGFAYNKVMPVANVATSGVCEQTNSGCFSQSCPPGAHPQPVPAGPSFSSTQLRSPPPPTAPVLPGPPKYSSIPIWRGMPSPQPRYDPVRSSPQPDVSLAPITRKTDDVYLRGLGEGELDGFDFDSFLSPELVNEDATDGAPCYWPVTNTLAPAFSKKKPTTSHSWVDAHDTFEPVRSPVYTPRSPAYMRSPRLSAPATGSNQATIRNGLSIPELVEYNSYVEDATQACNKAVRQPISTFAEELMRESKHESTLLRAGSKRGADELSSDEMPASGGDDMDATAPIDPSVVAGPAIIEALRDSPAEAVVLREPAAKRRKLGKGAPAPRRGFSGATLAAVGASCAVAGAGAFMAFLNSPFSLRLIENYLEG